MPRSRRYRIVRFTLIGLSLTLAVGVVSRIQVAGGTWLIKSAATPEGWPDPTPVGEVQVRSYPEYRAAVVSGADLSRDDMGGMFMELFRHIQRNDIAMTTPVDMGYALQAGQPRMASMAFLYRHPGQGEPGADGAVLVEDLEPQAYASIGVRGDYTDQRFVNALDDLDAWLLRNTSEWIPVGPARYLGYNGPFVPKFMKYGEVQVPLRARVSATVQSLGTQDGQRANS